MKTLWVVIFAILHALLCVEGRVKDFDLVAQWKDLSFEFPSPKAEADARASKKYVPGNSVPIDVDVFYKRGAANPKIFVTMPRFSTGVPFTLATLVPGTQSQPKLRPYPSYDYHSSHGTNCSGITSVFRVAIDECQRLWVSDSGRIDATQHCPPSLHVFDLKTDQRIHRYEFPSNQFTPGVTLLVTPIVDVMDPPPLGQCRNTKVYTADVSSYSILVYDAVTDRSWRVENRLMQPVQANATFHIAGESFVLDDGILGMSLSPKQGIVFNNGNKNGYGGAAANLASQLRERNLYFHALASVTENFVPLSILSNPAIWQQNKKAMPNAFRVVGHRPTQTPAEAMDQNGNMFFGLLNPLAIACWHIDTPYNEDNIHVLRVNNVTLQFTSGIKVIKNGNQDELWVSSCRFQKVMAGTMNFNEINFRIQKIKTKDLLRGKRCSSPFRNRIGDDEGEEEEEEKEEQQE